MYVCGNFTFQTDNPWWVKGYYFINSSYPSSLNLIWEIYLKLPVIIFRPAIIKRKPIPTSSFYYVFISIPPSDIFFRRYLNGSYYVFVNLKECCDKTLSIFCKSAYRKNYKFLKWNNWKNFFCLQPSIFFIFVKIWTPVFNFFFFGWWIYDINNENISRELIVFQVLLNFDPVKKYWK